MKTKINKKIILKIGFPLIFGLFLGWVFFGGNRNDKQEKTEVHDHEEQAETIWTCSMHPQIKQNKPGLCPICAMELIALKSVGSEPGVDPNELPMTEMAVKLADIRTIKASKGSALKNIYLQGKIEVDERNVSSITTRFGGRIERLYVNFTGQYVRKGQKLASIYSPKLVTAQKELIEAVKLKQTNPSFYRASRNKLRLWDLTDEQINNIEKRGKPEKFFDYLSPLTGTVTKRFVTLGEYKNEGGILFEIVNLNKVWALFDAYESDLPWINNGDIVKFDLQSMESKEYKGKVSYIDPVIDPATRVAKVRVELDNPEQKLKPEMFVNGIIESVRAAEVNRIIIPKSSILWTGKRAVVYVKIPERKNPTFIYREILLGPNMGEYYIVNKGLKEGEEIAVNGVFRIDAAAQLAGKKSMMNPHGNGTGVIHQHEMKKNEMKKQDMESAEFKVGGVCGMCKNRIEEAAKSVNGVEKAEWNQETKILSVSYNPDKVKLIDIHRAIVKVGHDTDKLKADDKIYKELPPCCKYREQ